MMIKSQRNTSLMIVTEKHFLDDKVTEKHFLDDSHRETLP